MVRMPIVLIGFFQDFKFSFFDAPKGDCQNDETANKTAEDTSGALFEAKEIQLTDGTPCFKLDLNNATNQSRQGCPLWEGEMQIVFKLVYCCVPLIVVTKSSSFKD